MQAQDGAFEATPFSYDILDNEAAKISDLVSAVQKKIVQHGAQTAFVLFNWAEEFDSRGERDQAEFLYLHFIGWCEKQYGAVYPIAFTGLRDYARTLYDRATNDTKLPKAS